MLYIALKHIHLASVVLSLLLFAWRGLRAIFGLNNNAFMYRVLPHIIDTVLLLSAGALAWQMRQYPFVHGWLTAKVVALVVYIVLGYMAVKKASNAFARFAYFIAALAVFAYIIGVARMHSVWSWWAGSFS